MTEWERIKREVNNATDDQIEAWQATFNERLYGCGFNGDRSNFLRLLSNAYHKFPEFVSVRPTTSCSRDLRWAIISAEVRNDRSWEILA